jgi:glycine/serine hydroxymethyltransferase
MEMGALQLAQGLFNAKYVDLRPLSGEMAVKAMFTGLASPGDKVLETGPTDGGHGRETNAHPGLSQWRVDLEYLPVKDYQLTLIYPGFARYLRTKAQIDRLWASHSLPRANRSG